MSRPWACSISKRMSIKMDIEAMFHPQQLDPSGFLCQKYGNISVTSIGRLQSTLLAEYRARPGLHCLHKKSCQTISANFWYSVRNSRSFYVDHTLISMVFPKDSLISAHTLQALLANTTFVMARWTRYNKEVLTSVQLPKDSPTKKAEQESCKTLKDKQRALGSSVSSVCGSSWMCELLLYSREDECLKINPEVKQGGTIRKVNLKKWGTMSPNSTLLLYGKEKDTQNLHLNHFSDIS